MDFDFVPFGNAYVEIEECHGRATTYGCWKRHCGPKATDRPSDCFTGKPVCQHGPEECYGNIVEACVKNMTGGDPTVYMPFVNCFEHNGKVSQDQLRRCAPIARLTEPQVTACQNGTLGHTLIAEAARKTVMVPGRDYTPYFVVGGKVLKNSDDLLHTVCKDYTGPKPSGCSRMRTPGAATVKRCYN